MTHRILGVAAALALTLFATVALADPMATTTEVKFTNNTSIRLLNFAIEPDDGAGGTLLHAAPRNGGTISIKMKNYARSDSYTHENRFILFNGEEMIGQVMMEVTNKQVLMSGPLIEKIKVYTSMNKLGCTLQLNATTDSPDSTVSIVLSNCGD